MAKFEIRPVRPDDLSDLLSLFAEHAAFEQAAFDPAGKLARLTELLFGPKPRLRCVVALADGALCGYTSWSHEVSTWDAAEYVHVDCLYLKAEARASGVAIRMIEQMAIEAEAAGMLVAPAQWQTPPFNEPAIKLYEALGAQRKDKARFYLTPESIAKLSARGTKLGRGSLYVSA